MGNGELALRAWSVDAIRPGNSTRVNIWANVTRPLTYTFGYTFQFIDQASQDTILTFNTRSGIDPGSWIPGDLFLRKLDGRFRVPETTSTNRAQWLTVSFWKIDGDEFPPLPIDSSDYPLLGDTHIILDEFVLQEPTGSLGQDDALALFANGFALEWADLPESVQAGETTVVEFQWSSINDGEEDWTQFLHFVPEAGGSLWNVDQYPLGRRLPTRLWYAGMQSGERWNFTVPPDLAAGTYDVYTGLYRLADLQRLEVTLANGQRPDDGRIPLGNISIEN